jgi:hypothetical protein
MQKVEGSNPFSRFEESASVSDKGVVKPSKLRQRNQGKTAR